MKTLTLADDLKLPIDVVTQTMAILAKRRSGKSYAMRRLVEQLFKAGQQIVLVDPKGDQWGIRYGADGKSPGLPVVILGGEHGDVKLEPGAGAVIAKLVAEERVSVVIDLSEFRKGEVARFMGGPTPPQRGEEGFLEALYRLKAREEFRTPLMLVIDEADAIAPQKPQSGEERMLGAAEDIVRRGGQRGIGCVVVTQRSAVLNKNVLTQAQILVALRTIAPQDLEAMKAWIDVHGEADQRKTLMESLPALPVGDAWFWSPGWPTVEGIFKRVHVLPIETFDSGATPKPGEKRKEPKNIADVDLAALTRQMAETIEKAKADDPRELKKTISELKATLATKDKVLGQVDAQTKRIEEKLERAASTSSGTKLTEIRQQLARHRRAIEETMKILVKVKALDFPVETDDDRKALEQAIAGAVRQVTAPIEKRVTALAARVEGIRKAAGEAEKAITALLEEKIDLTVQVQKREPFAVSAPAPRAPRPRPAARAATAGEPPAGELLEPERRILDSLGWWSSAGLDQPTRHQVAFGARYTVNGHFNNTLGGLRARGLVDYPAQGAVSLTDAGLAAAATPPEPPTGAALVQRVLAVLREEPQQRLFSALVDATTEGQASITREALATRCNYTVNGHFNNTLGSLKSLGLAAYPARGQVTLGPMFDQLGVAA